MNHRFTSIFRRQPLLIALAALWLLATQTAAQMHSIDHLFHQTVDSCAAYHSLEHHKPGVINPPQLIKLDLRHELELVISNQNIARTSVKAWLARAPPFTPVV